MSLHWHLLSFNLITLPLLSSFFIGLFFASTLQTAAQPRKAYVFNLTNHFSQHSYLILHPLLCSIKILLFIYCLIFLSIFLSLSLAFFTFKCLIQSFFLTLVSFVHCLKEDRRFYSSIAHSPTTPPQQKLGKFLFFPCCFIVSYFCFDKQLSVLCLGVE